MSVPHPENPALDPAFPDVVDDDYPERSQLVDPEEPSLPGDHYVGVQQVGTTTQEQIEGETLNRKIAREVPEIDDTLPSSADEGFDDETEQPAGRLVAPDQGVNQDDEPDAIAEGFLDGESDASPEEAAMHVRQG